MAALTPKEVIDLIYRIMDPVAKKIGDQFGDVSKWINQATATISAVSKQADAADAKIKAMEARLAAAEARLETQERITPEIKWPIAL